MGFRLGPGRPISSPTPRLARGDLPALGPGPPPPSRAPASFSRSGLRRGRGSACPPAVLGAPGPSGPQRAGVVLVSRGPGLAFLPGSGIPRTGDSRWRRRGPANP
eukprot:13540482-Alexandrium_andersonii.AAC.1